MSAISRKAAFFDLDGTLAVHNLPPAPEDADAIRRFRAAGHLAFLCTGRASGYIYPSVLDIGFDGVVASAGAHVTLDGKILYRRTVSPEVLRRMITDCRQTGCICVFEGEQGMYVINEEKYPQLANSCAPVRTPEDFETVYAGHVINKFTLYSPLTAGMQAWMDGFFSLIQHPDYLEVVPKGCSKSDGIRRVIESAGIRREDVLAVGDSANDLDMLRYAGIGAAMGNASDEVKAAADWVTGTLAQHGAAQALLRFENM